MRASLWTVLYCDALARLGRDPKREDVLEASTQLVGWSNSLNDERSDRQSRRVIIANRLGIIKKIGVY